MVCAGSWSTPSVLLLLPALELLLVDVQNAPEYALTQRPEFLQREVTIFVAVQPFELLVDEFLGDLDLVVKIILELLEEPLELSTVDRLVIVLVCLGEELLNQVLLDSPFI